MEVLQAAEFLFFAIPTGTSCPQVTFEMENSTKIRALVNGESNTFNLGGKVVWPGSVSLSSNGTIKLQLLKKKVGNWTKPVLGPEDRPNNTNKYAKPKFTDDDLTPDLQRYRAEWRDIWPVKVESVRSLNPTVCEIVLKHVENVFHYIHPGRYICIYLRLKGRRTKRPFYPTIKVPFYNLTYPNQHALDYHLTSDSMTILVNDYGRKDSLPDRICTKRPLNDSLYVSGPRGSFCPSYMEGINKIQVVCESSGIGPVLPVILHALQTNPFSSVKVFYFNQDEEDIIYKEHLDHIADIEKRFQIQYILRNPNKGWSGWKGVIKPTYLEKILQRYTPEDKIYSIMAGHRQFVFPISTWMVRDMGFPNRTVYRFMTI